jgi:ribosome-associated protein
MTDTVSVEALTLARAIVSAAADKKAENLVLLDLRALSTVADYFVICSGGSERQLRAIADGIDEAIGKEHRAKPTSVTGTAGGGWVLMDYSAVVVHIFLPSQRAYYNLEALWQKAPVLLRVQ